MGLIACSLCSRGELLLEILALRQQLTVLQVRHPRPRLTNPDRVFWVMLLRFWSGWKRTLVIVQPATVIGWHRAGFKLYWTWRSRHKARAGRKPVSRELRELIVRMVGENPSWGAPRIHGELKMLGLGISERTVSRWMRKASRNPEPAKQWEAFLNNHREAIAAMDFLWCAVWLLCHHAQPAPHLALQCNQAPNERVGSATVARGISVRVGTRIPDL
jgi:putative transposase